MRCTQCSVQLGTTSLAAVDDHQKVPGPFVVPVEGECFGGLVGEIDRNLWPQSNLKLRSAFGAGLK
jgi:hypothetical protein